MTKPPAPKRVSSGFTGPVPVLRLSASGRSKRHFFRWVVPGAKKLQHRQPVDQVRDRRYLAGNRAPFVRTWLHRAQSQLAHDAGDSTNADLDTVLIQLGGHAPAPYVCRDVSNTRLTCSHNPRRLVGVLGVQVPADLRRTPPLFQKFLNVSAAEQC